MNIPDEWIEEIKTQTVYGEARVRFSWRRGRNAYTHVAGADVVQSRTQSVFNVGLAWGRLQRAIADRCLARPFDVQMEIEAPGCVVLRRAVRFSVPEKIYLAARYGRRLELCQVRDRLLKRGHPVCARWLDGAHQIDDQGAPLGEDGERAVESGGPEAAKMAHHFATEDETDIILADTVVCFTEPPRSIAFASSSLVAAASRGGRHVELGLALAHGKRVIVVGHRENVFCWLERVEFVETADQLVDLLGVVR